MVCFQSYSSTNSRCIKTIFRCDRFPRNTAHGFDVDQTHSSNLVVSGPHTSSYLPSLCTSNATSTVLHAHVRGPSHYLGQSYQLRESRHGCEGRWIDSVGRMARRRELHPPSCNRSRNLNLNRWPRTLDLLNDTNSSAQAVGKLSMTQRCEYLVLCSPSALSLSENTGDITGLWFA